jgi:carbamoyl-phosphate synthase large subunit
MPPITVAVTGLNATDNPGPGVAVINALRADPTFDGRIIGLAYDGLDPGLYREGLLDAAFLIPYPSAGREALFERLTYIKSRVGLDVFMPTLDSELPAVLDQEAALAKLGIRTFLPTRAQYDLRSKARLLELHTKYDIPVPYAEVLTDPAALYQLQDRFEFPIVVKGVYYGAKVAYTVDEAVKAFHKAAAEWGLPIIVQQFLPGEDYNVCALGDGKGGLVGAVAMKKLMVTDSGKGWAGVTIDDPPLLALTERIMDALKWRGGCEVEVRRDARGGYHLLEINPRFPAWCDLTAGAGQNLPAASVRLALGEPVEPLPAYTVGTAFVRISLNQIVPISALEAISTLGEVVPEPTR